MPYFSLKYLSLSYNVLCKSNPLIFEKFCSNALDFYNQEFIIFDMLDSLLSKKFY